MVVCIITSVDARVVSYEAKLMSVFEFWIGRGELLGKISFNCPSFCLWLRMKNTSSRTSVLNIRRSLGGDSSARRRPLRIKPI